MFDTLSTRLDDIFSRLRARGRLSEKEVDDVLREIRLALLEADVSLRVVKAFVKDVRERAEGAEIHKSLTPAQQVIKLVHAALIDVLGHEAAGLEVTSVVLTKLDGDARGGAALSMSYVTGRPIKFAGVGEKLSDPEPFHPDRMASRILGMGDVLTLIEKAEEAFDEAEAKKMEEKLRKAEFTFEDFLSQMQALKKMGPMSQVL